MKKYLLTLTALLTVTTSWAQSDTVMNTLRLVNDYFMAKYADPTLPTNVNRIRPSSLWTRAVYYEGLMALYEIDPEQRYIDYTDRWASFHQWTPRNGVTTCDADDQCCGQTYAERYLQVRRQEAGDSCEKMIAKVIENLNNQMMSPNPRADNELFGWWTWIDAIQMAMPLYMQVYKITGDRRYADHAMQMYRWSRNTLAGGLFNEKEGLWWRDKDYVPPYQTPDGKNCYWSRGNGWVYAALVRCMNLLSPKHKTEAKYYKELKKDFLLMSTALKACQRPEDGLWNPSLVSYADYGGKEMSGTALFLYGMSWGIRNGLLKPSEYRPVCDRAWKGLLRDCVHPDGFLGWAQGTGKDPSAGQPLSYTKVPDFEDYGTGCFLLGGTEYYKLVK